MDRPTSTDGLVTVTVPTVAYTGATAHLARVQAFTAPGVPGDPDVVLLGVPADTAGQTIDRLRTAVVNSGLSWPTQPIVLRVSGHPHPITDRGLDAAFAVAVLAVIGQLPTDSVTRLAVLGELGADGRLHTVRGMRERAAVFAAAGVPAAVVATGDLHTAVRVLGDTVRAAGTLRDLAAALHGDGALLRPDAWPTAPGWPGADLTDLPDGPGLQPARRALEVAAAGGHHLAVLGPPGSGKVMLAQRLPGLLPDLDQATANQVAGTYRSAGLLEPDAPVLRRPPWQAPHHTSSLPALTGTTTRPGAAALANGGVLFLDDAGWAEYQRLRSQIQAEPNLAAHASLTALLHRHRTDKQPLPGATSHRTTPGVARAYLAALHHASLRQVKTLLERRRDPTVELDVRTPIDVTIHGRLHGQPWMPHINFYDAPVLMRRLSAAGLIVITYLSGLRPGEAFELETGCCRTRTTVEGATRYELHGKFFKGARDSEGTLLPDGAQRKHPWTTIQPVARAVEVLERIALNRHLFPADEPWNPSTDTSRQWRTGACITSKAATTRIATFIAWVNNVADESGLGPADRIPPDPGGAVTTSRFRRTIAWHIARLPGGRIALALQYGHLRTTVSSGYGNRARHGLRRVLDIETARAIADYLQQLDHQLNSGESVSGPAAGQLIRSARSAARFEGMFLGKPEVRALLHEPEFQVFDNPDAFLTCNKDPTKALCDPDRATRARTDTRPPSLDRCNPACANIARTDRHIAAARAEAAGLRGDVTDPLTPLPLRTRLEQRISTLTTMIQRHERTCVRTTPQQS